MTIYYLLPLLGVVLVVVVAKFGQKLALQSVQNMSPEQARAKMHEFYADSFDLAPGETLFATWMGEEYQGDSSTAAQVAGAALNKLSSAAIGFSTYVPTVRIAVTSLGRVLIAREYSELGERGNFKQIFAFGAGTQALDASSARPGQAMRPPLAHPLGQNAPPEFVQFRAPSGQFYEAWMLGGQTLEGSFVLTFRNVSAQAASVARPVPSYA